MPFAAGPVRGRPARHRSMASERREGATRVRVNDRHTGIPITRPRPTGPDGATPADATHASLSR